MNPNYTLLFKKEFHKFKSRRQNKGKEDKKKKIGFHRSIPQNLYL